MNLEAVFCIAVIITGALSWGFFMYTFIRDDIRSERERKEKIAREKEFDEKFNRDIF